MTRATMQAQPDARARREGTRRGRLVRGLQSTVLGTSVLMGALGGGCECGDDPDPPAADTGTTGCPPDVCDPATTTGLGSLDSTGSPTSGDGSTSTGPSSVGIPDECTLSADCPAGEFCVAPFDESLGPEGKGPLACVTECVGLMDEARWCADADACCNSMAECTDRGYCVIPGDTDTGGETDTGGATDTGGGTTGGTSGTGGSAG